MYGLLKLLMVLFSEIWLLKVLVCSLLVKYSVFTVLKELTYCSLGKMNEGLIIEKHYSSSHPSSFPSFLLALTMLFIFLLDSYSISPSANIYFH